MACLVSLSSKLTFVTQWFGAVGIEKLFSLSHSHNQRNIPQSQKRKTQIYVKNSWVLKNTDLSVWCFRALAQCSTLLLFKLCKESFFFRITVIPK